MAIIFLNVFGSNSAFAKTIAETSAKKNSNVKTEKIALAAGCFWGTEEFFRKIPGVVKTEVGYTGGTTNNPKYEEMADDHTGHAEAVMIEYNPAQVSLEKLLDQFFKMHDPTTKNRQGNDRGLQYRSAIFYHSESQKEIAVKFKSKVEASQAWKAPVVTEISNFEKFWPAESYHQKYLIKNPGGYDNHYLRSISFDTVSVKK